MRIALAQINPTIGSLPSNLTKILTAIEKAKQYHVEVVVFPEMCLCGYPPEDLLLLPSFIEAVNETLEKVIEASSGIYVIIGTVRENPSIAEKNLFNTAAIIFNGALVGFQDKSLLPTYDVFSERRYFEPAIRTDVWSINQKRVAITICEDIWQHSKAAEYSFYHRDPILDLIAQKPDLVINLSASPYNVLKFSKRMQVASQVAETLQAPVLLCNLVGGNDSLIFDGYSFCVDSSKNLLCLAKGFEEDLLIVDTDQTHAPLEIAIDPIEDLYHALILGVRDYFQKSGFSRACIGISGGIDSAVVACIAIAALGQENVIALGLPSRYNPTQSLKDAEKLVQNLGIEYKMISIEDPFQCFLNLFKEDFKGLAQNVTEENLQARIRGTILMAFSNKFGYLLLSTGNKSEMAMGYTTLYGDMCGGLAVISDVSKMQVYALANYINKNKEIIPEHIIKKAPSAELNFDQKDCDSLPDYQVLDQVLQGYVEDLLSPEQISKKYNLSLDLIKQIIKKIHLSEYKRRQAPPGLRVTKKAFGIGRKFPIVQHWYDA